MKNFQFILAGILLASCEKEYECSCHKASGAHEHIVITAKKADAKGECKALEAGTYTSCELE